MRSSRVAPEPLLRSSHRHVYPGKPESTASDRRPRCAISRYCRILSPSADRCHGSLRCCHRRSPLDRGHRRDEGRALPCSGSRRMPFPRTLRGVPLADAVAGVEYDNFPCPRRQHDSHWRRPHDSFHTPPAPLPRGWTCALPRLGVAGGSVRVASDPSRALEAARCCRVPPPSALACARVAVPPRSVGSDGWRASTRAPKSPRRPATPRTTLARFALYALGRWIESPVSPPTMIQRYRWWRPRSQKPAIGHARIAVKRAAAMFDRGDRMQRTPPSYPVRKRSCPEEPVPTAILRPSLRDPRVAHSIELRANVAIHALSAP